MLGSSPTNVELTKLQITAKSSHKVLSCSCEQTDTNTDKVIKSSECLWLIHLTTFKTRYKLWDWRFLIFWPVSFLSHTVEHSSLIQPWKLVQNVLSISIVHVCIQDIFWEKNACLWSVSSEYGWTESILSSCIVLKWVSESAMISKLPIITITPPHPSRQVYQFVSGNDPFEDNYYPTWT